MKRQTEELFFNYIANPTQGAYNEININVPDEIDFLPGDIIEMIVSERPNTGGVSYCARLICYDYDDGGGGTGLNVGLLSGLLANKDGDYPIPAKAASLWIPKERYISLYSDVDSVYFPEGSTFSVNLSIHRSKKEITLYYV